MNKKIGKIIACASLMATVVAGSSLLFACNDTDEPQRLDAPVISLDGNVVSWTAVEHATSYDVTVGTETENTTDTSYTISVSETGDYKVSVVAKTTASGWTASAKSNELTYTYKTLNERLTLDARPTKTVYYLDENATELDLAGIQVKAGYSNGSSEAVVASKLTVKGTLDLSTVGLKLVELQYTEGGVTALCDFRIEVKQRTVADLDREGVAYTTAENEYSSTATNYKISDSRLTSVTDMTGAAVSVTADDNGTYIAASEFTKSGAKLVKADGAFINVVAGIYIDSVDDFIAINDNLDGYYVLQRDLDFGATELGSNGALVNVWANGKNTSIIGTAPLKELAGDEGPIYEFEFSGDELAVEGRAFTGTFDGNGYKIKHMLLFYPTDPEGGVPVYSAYEKEAQTLSMFGYIGEGGKVSNFTLSSSVIVSGKNSGLIAAANLGTIENVVIDSDCSLSVIYQGSAAVAAYNGGLIKNVVSYATNINGAEAGAAARVSGAKSDSAVETNTFLGEAAQNDNSSALGSGWVYIQDYGTVYVNSSYNKLVSYEPTWYIGQDVHVKVYSVDGANSFTVTTWGIPGYNADNPAFTLETTDENGLMEFTLKWADGVTSDVLPANSKFVIAFGNEVSGTFGTVAITVGTPYTLSVESVGGTLTCEKDEQINLGGVSMVVNLSDGGTKTVQPTKIEGAFDSSTTGDKEVTFVYEENGIEFKKTATVNVFEAAAAVRASLKTGVDKVIIAYDNGWSLDNVTWTDFFDITDGSDALTGYNVTVTGAMYGESVTFTIAKDGYSSATVTAPAYLGVGSKAAFNAINDNLSGWYILTDNIDFEETGTIIGLPPTRDESASENGWFIDLSKANGNAFTGKFDGQGHTLSNWMINKSGWQFENYYGAMFGYIGTGAYVGNFIIDNASVSASQDASIVAALNCGTIDNVRVNSNCSVTVAYGRKGAFAIVNNGTITDYVNSTSEDVVYGGADYTSTGTATPAEAGSPSDSL